MSQGFLSSVDNTTSNIQDLSQRDEEIMRTNVQVVQAEQSDAVTLLVTVKNSGQTKLTAFSRWDVIVHSQDAEGTRHVNWLPYTDGTPSANEWTVQGIYLDAGGGVPEAFEPGIVNPDEEVVLQCKLSPAVGAGTINLVSITTPNGVTVSNTFNGYVAPE